MFTTTIRIFQTPTDHIQITRWANLLEKRCKQFWKTTGNDNNRRNNKSTVVSAKQRLLMNLKNARLLTRHL